MASAPAGSTIASPPAASSHPAGINATALTAEIQRLLHAKLYRSAYILANFLLPHSTPHQPSPSPPPSSSSSSSSPYDPLPFYLFAESLNNADLREHRRSLHYYQLTLDALSLLPPSLSHTSSSPLTSLTPLLVQSRMVDAWMSVGDDDATLALLESIVPPSPSSSPSPFLPPHQLLHLASLYRRRRQPSHALLTYQRVLHQQPHCMEAMLAIIDLTHDDVSSVFPSELPHVHPSLHSFLLAHVASSTSGGAQHVEAIHRMSALCLHHPLSAWLHVRYSEVQQQWYDDEVCINTLQHAHQLDRHMTDGLDTLALLQLAQPKRAKQLQRLQFDALQAADSRPEGWSISALTALAAGQRERCERLIEKAVHLDEWHTTTRLVKAYTLLNQDALGGGGGGGGASLAFPALFATLNLHLALRPSAPCLPILHPLVLSYLSLAQPKKAFNLLAPHHRRNPHNPRILTLLALTLSTPPTLPPSLVKAKEALVQAVSVDRYAFGAVMALASVMAEEGRLEEAIGVLKRSCEGEVEGGAYVEGVVERLGSFNAKKGDRAEALKWYQQTLRVNPANAVAAEGIKSVEEDVKHGEQVVLYK